jgi:putative ABC transport system permease protein
VFRYYLKLAVLSIRTNPVLSGLMVAAIATGIGACVTILNIEHVMGSNPIPQRSDMLFYVQLDSWDPHNAAVEPDLPPRQVTLRDGTAIMEAARARRQTISYKTLRVVEPRDPDQRPFQVESRSTTADFFPMFDTPFLYGSGWDAAADRNQEYVVVINRDVNEILFGGENSVGQTIVMNGESWRITGVLDTWNPMPKFYDLNNSQFDAAEEVYFPFSIAIAKGLNSRGNTNCWKAPEGNGREAFYASECVWLQLWLELHGEQEKQGYLSFLNAYAEAQKALGRFERPINNRLSNVTEWMQIEGVVPDDVRVLLGLAVLFLVVCLLNTVGLILAKVMRRAGDISLRRALGASRLAIFTQYIIEAGVVGATGGLFGIIIAWLGLQGIRVLYGQDRMVEHITGLEWSMTLAAVGLAIASALAAALYPTWRACSIQPAAQLKAL